MTTAAAHPRLPRAMSQTEVAHALSAYYVLVDGLVMRDYSRCDWPSAEAMVRERWGERAWRRVKRMARGEAEARFREEGLLP